MAKRVAWAFIHAPNKIHPGVALPNAAKHPLNFVSQEIIKDLINAQLPEKNKDRLNLEKLKERMVLHEQHFKEGAVQAYKVLLSDLCNREDFVASCYCTPQLSFTLNFLSFRMKNILVEFPRRFSESPPSEVTATVLGQWVEMREARSNDKVLGLWDAEHIGREVSAGFMGPEGALARGNEDDMTYIPATQTVRLAYSVKYKGGESESGGADCDDYERIDVFEWERSLSCPIDKEEWTISNINSVLINK